MSSVHPTLIFLFIPFQLGWFFDRCIQFPFSIHVISCLSSAPQILPSLDTGSNSLRPTYDWNVPTYLNESLDHRRNRDAPAGAEPPFIVTDYIALYKRCLDAWSYQEALQKGDVMTFQARMDLELGTMLSAWHQRWNHWVSRIALDFRYSSFDMGCHFICCREEIKKLNMKERYRRYSLGCVNMANCLTRKVRIIFDGLYRQIVHGWCIVMIIGAGIATSNWDDRPLAERRPSLGDGTTSICSPFSCSVVNGFRKSYWLITWLGT